MVELAESTKYLWTSRPIELDDKAKALITSEARQVLEALVPEFEALDSWGAGPAEEVVRSYAERTGLKLGAVAQPLRAALTGRVTSPGIFEVLAVLGKRESVARIKDLVSEPS